jgi:hypothetical protein
MAFSANGTRYVGVGLLQRATRTVIQFELPPKTRELAITTCHREEFHYPAGAATFSWAYVPTMWLENWDTCLITATAFTDSGSTAKALIDWTSNEFLPGTIHCNGTKTDGVKGATICQSRAGLVQMISFTEKVQARGTDRCAAVRSESGQDADWRWFVDISPGLCIYAFRDEKKQLHRLTTYGYTGATK